MPVEHPPRPWEPVDRDSGPEASAPCTQSSGGAPSDGAQRAHSGPGPIINQLAFVRLIAEYLEQTAGTASDTDGDSTSSLRQMR